MGEGIQSSLGLGIWGVGSEAFRHLKGGLQSLWCGDKHLWRVLDQETALLEEIPPLQNHTGFFLLPFFHTQDQLRGLE